MCHLKVIVFCALFVAVSSTGLDADDKNDESRKTPCGICVQAKNVSCIAEVCDCAECTLIAPIEDADNSTIEMETRRYSQRLAPPNLYCQDDGVFAFVWDTADNTSYFLEYTFESDRKYTNLTYNGYEIIRDVIPEARYVIQLTSIRLSENSSVVIQRSVPLRIRSLRSNRTPFPVPSIYLNSFSLVADTYTAQVKWKQAGDKCCYYDIVWFTLDSPGHYTQVEINDPLSAHEVNITGLDFGKDYLVEIRAVSDGTNRRRESSEVRVNLTTPSCLDSYESLEKCTPETPTDLATEETVVDGSNANNPLYDVELSWSQPRFSPDFYTAYLFIYSENKTLPLNITGNSTSALYKDVALGIYYEVTLVAISRKGRSLPATLYRYLNSTASPLAPKKSTISTEVILIVVFPFIIVGLALMVLCNQCLVKRIRTNYFKQSEEKDVSAVNYTITEPSVREQDDEWEIQIEKLIIKDVLGEGAFGVVRRGCIITENENVEVAIKMLRDNPTQDELKQFYQEIDIMKSVPPHPHLVSLIGCITRANKWPLLVVEYCSKGDLQSYLRSAWDKLTNPSVFGRVEVPNTKYASNILYDLQAVCIEKNIPQPKDLISFARQIALGMEYLSSLKVIHRDLAARNVLVCENNAIKISDFGLSRDVYHNNVYCKTTGGKVPIRWLALESVTHQIYTTQSDVWSFGILLWEIVTLGSTPYPGVATEDLLLLLKGGYRMERPSNCSDEIYSLMCKCWKASPRERPTFSELRTSLDLILERVSQYLTLNVSQPADVSTYRKNEINRYKNINCTGEYVKKITGL